MARFEETRLPGVGVRHEFVTQQGRRVGVISRHSGRRELVIYDDDDPDAVRAVLRLEEADSRALVELLGGSEVTATLADLQQRVEGLAIDWLGVGARWFAAGRSIAETQLRRRTGVSIVALLRGSQTIPSPEPDEVLQPDDVAVVVGTPEGIERATAVLREG